MSALNSVAMLLEKGNIYVGSYAGDVVDLGAVRKVQFTGKQVPTKVESDNRGTIVNRLRLNGEIEFDWLEPASVSNIELLFKGVVAKTVTAGSSTPVTGEVTASGAWAYARLIFFAKQNGSQAIPTSVTVTGSVDGLLTLDTNYRIEQDPGTKQWGVAIKSGGAVTTLNQTITLAYTVTPNASVTLTGGTNLTQTPRYIKIVGPLDSDATKTRTIILTECVVTSDMVLPFVDVEAANDVGVMPVKAESNKGTTWTLTDQINTL
jgi:hypothetical protein